MKKIYVFWFLMISVGMYAIEPKDTVSVQLKEVSVQEYRKKLYNEGFRVITVIPKQDIEKMAVKSLDDLLDKVSGVDIRQRGTDGMQSDISIRGGSFDQVLVLLNGVNITDPQTGHYNLDVPVSLTDIVRIEVLQGASARVLGPNAFSGAINIITEKPASNSLGVYLSGGSYATFGQGISGSLAGQRWRWYSSFQHKSSDGYMHNTDFDNYNAFTELTYDGRKAGHFSAQFAFQYKGYGANSFYSLAYPEQYDRTITFFSAVKWDYTKGNFNLASQAYWRRHHDRFELFRNITDAPAWYKNPNYHQTDITGGKATATLISAAGKSSVGIDIRDEHIYSNVLGNLRDTISPIPFDRNGFFNHEKNRVISTFLLNHTLNLSNFDASIGLGESYSNDFGWHTYGGADLSYRPCEVVRLFVSANNTVRLPTFTDLYYTSATQKSNPNLNPEKSKTFEGGVKAEKQGWKTELTAFYRWGNNVIDWVKSPDSTKWESRNLTKVNAYGVDISAEYRFKNLMINKISVSYSFLNMDKKANGLDSKYTLDYLKHKAVLIIDHKIVKNISVSWNLSYADRSGSYTDKNKLLRNYQPYFLTDARANWMLRRITVYAEVNNLFDKKYEDYGGLPQPGINISAGLKWKMF